MVMVVPMVMMVPGPGRGFGGGATHEQSRGDESERGTRAGNTPRQQVHFEHLVKFPLNSIATFGGQ
jgi:hypothetical protein